MPITLSPRRLAFWRSPEDQSWWYRPVLLLIAALAGVSYAWRINGDGLEPYYAAAVRSMAGSWHDFWYGAFDPAGLVSLDKLPGAFWLQALSVRVFGMHTWAIALPQVVEGVLTVLVLYRAVRRLAGPAAATVAAAVFALSPAVVALDRGNIADTLLILLLVLAADATTAALDTGRWRTLLLAGLWVGLAFQAKMVQAWLVLPALGVAYALAAPGSLRRRLAQLGAAGAVTAAVSLSWAVVVTLIPAGDRPYADGSTHNSVLEQVFGYNGFGRFDAQNSLQHLGAVQSALIPASTRATLAGMRADAGWHRLFSGGYGHDAGWLLPLALVIAVGLVVARGGRDRRDAVRAGAVLWGLWLVAFVGAFSTAHLIQPYYVAVLAPPVAALTGIGARWAWGAGPVARIVAAAVAAATVGYQVWLLPDTGTGRPGWLTALAIAAFVVAIVALAVAVAAVVLRGLPLAGRARGVPALALAAVLALPLAAAGSVVGAALGPFDTPFQPEAATAYTRTALVRTPDEVRRAIPQLQRIRGGATYLLGTSNGLLAADFIWTSGQEVLPIGGFTGTYPVPSLDRLRELIAGGQLHLVLTLPSDDDPRVLWIRAHCRALPSRGTSGAAIPERYYFYCQPADAS